MTVEKVLPTVDIELGGKARHLRMTLGAMARFEKATGLNMFALGDNWCGSATEMQALLWACLVADEPTLTPEAVGDWVDAQSIESVTNALMKAWGVASAEGEQADPLANEKPPPG